MYFRRQAFIIDWNTQLLEDVEYKIPLNKASKEV